MSDNTRLSKLREKAVEALLQGKELDATLSPKANMEFQSLLEELRIYQAELEIQNEELIESIRDRERLLSHYQSLFNLVPLPLLILSKKAELLELNEVANDTLALRPSVLNLPRSLYSVLEEDSAIEFNDALAACVDGHDNKSGMTIIFSHLPEKTFTGTLVKITESIIHRDGAALLILRDMSVEEELALRRRVFERVIDQNEDTIVVLGPRYEILSANHHANNVITNEKGVKRWEFLQQKLPEDVTSIIEKTMESHSLPTRVEPVYHRFRTNLVNEKEYKDYLLKCFKIYVNERGDIGVGIFISDETEKLENDHQLRLALSVYDMGNQAILLTDASAHITYVNNAYEIITGYSLQEVKGEQPNFLSTKQVEGTANTNIWEEIKNKGVWAGEIWNNRKNGEEFPEWLTVSRYPKHGPVQNYIAAFTDISELKNSEQQVHKLAFYDQLTGAGNRSLLKQHLATRIDKKVSSPFALVYMDLDKFKDINDIYGHEVGDELLRLVVRRTSGALRENDSLYRLGGDEFLIFVDDIDAEQIAKKAKKWTRMIESPFYIMGNEINISCSIGIAMYPKDGSELDILLKNADIAMYKVKESGRNGYEFFEPQLLAEVERRLSIEQQLRVALNNDYASWHLQPKVDLQTQEVVGYESLFRLGESNKDFITEEIIDVAGQCGLISALTIRALSSSLANVMSLHKNGDMESRVAVNLSPLDLSNEKQFASILACLDSHPAESKFIDIEITEAALMVEPEKKIPLLKQLKEKGCQIHLDDFGTGFSSLSFLSQYPIDLIKIDKQFIAKALHDKNANAICIAAIQLAKALDILCLGEGVENQEQVTFLKQHDCDFAQGFLFGHPQPVEYVIEQD